MIRPKVVARLAFSASALTLVLLVLTQGISRGETINPSTWAPSGSGAYFFDRSNLTGNPITDFSAREQQFGRKFDGHLYYLENCDVTPSMLADPHWSLAVDKVPFVVLSWCGGNNPDSIIPQIAAGKYDKDINDFAASIKSQLVSYGHVFIRPFWEFNYTGSEWNDTHYGGNAGLFIAAWQRVVNLFRTDGLSDSQVKFIWSPNRTAGQSQDPVAYYPGSSYVDWIGIDAYPKNQFLTLEQLVTTGDGFDWYSTFKSYGKPLMVSETGIQPSSQYGPGSPTRAQWWSDLVSEIEGPLSSIKAVEYFDSAPGLNWGYSAPGSSPQDSNAQAFAAARAAAHSCALDVLSPTCPGGAPAGQAAPTTPRAISRPVSRHRHRATSRSVSRHRHRHRATRRHVSRHRHRHRAICRHVSRHRHRHRATCRHVTRHRHRATCRHVSRHRHRHRATCRHVSRHRHRHRRAP
jgi:hypothetical protein